MNPHAFRISRRAMLSGAAHGGVGLLSPEGDVLDFIPFGLSADLATIDAEYQSFIRQIAYHQLHRQWAQAAQ